MDAQPSGFALRSTDQCGGTEVNCGATVGPYRTCCPNGSYCNNHYNQDCCPSKHNCTEAIIEKPKCANATWDLYANRGYYFCCKQGLQGYKKPDDSDGCADSGYSYQEGEVMLKLLSSGVSPTSSVLSTSSAVGTSSSSPVTGSPNADVTSPPPTHSSSSSSSSSNNTGAIVGGVVGGVAGVAVIGLAAWYLLRKRLSRKEANTNSYASEMDGAGMKPPLPVATELPTHHGASEMP